MHSAVCVRSAHFSRSRFTGKERDTESGNDYFGARYYASSMGRFMSPDWSAKEEPVPYATKDDPQSLNLYAYVGNNPLTHNDPDGHQNCTKTTLHIFLNVQPAGDISSTVCTQGLDHLEEMAYEALKNTASKTGSWWNKQAWIPPFLGGAPDHTCDNHACDNMKIEAGVMPWGMTGGLGLGLTGTKAAMTVAERLAIEAAESNPTAGKVLQTTLNDARWSAAKGWVKMESRSPGGIVVHWVRNTITGAVADFKLK